MQDFQIRYRKDSTLVLRGTSCTFEGGHKVGIVGRTASGKSTLISELFRLVEPAGGRIVVDGVDIFKIGLHDLRSRFGVIPQDPTLFNGTVLIKKFGRFLGNVSYARQLRKKRMGLIPWLWKTSQTGAWGNGNCFVWSMLF